MPKGTATMVSKPKKARAKSKDPGKGKDKSPKQPSEKFSDGRKMKNKSATPYKDAVEATEAGEADVVQAILGQEASEEADSHSDAASDPRSGKTKRSKRKGTTASARKRGYPSDEETVPTEVSDRPDSREVKLIRPVKPSRRIAVRKMQAKRSSTFSKLFALLAGKRCSAKKGTATTPNPTPTKSAPKPGGPQTSRKWRETDLTPGKAKLDRNRVRELEAQLAEATEARVETERALQTQLKDTGRWKAGKNKSTHRSLLEMPSPTVVDTPKYVTDKTYPPYAAARQQRNEKEVLKTELEAMRSKLTHAMAEGKGKAPNLKRLTAVHAKLDAIATMLGDLKEEREEQLSEAENSDPSLYEDDRADLECGDEQEQQEMLRALKESQDQAEVSKVDDLAENFPPERQQMVKQLLASAPASTREGLERYVFKQAVAASEGEELVWPSNPIQLGHVVAQYAIKTKGQHKPTDLPSGPSGLRTKVRTFDALDGARLDQNMRSLVQCYRQGLDKRKCFADSFSSEELNLFCAHIEDSATATFGERWDTCSDTQTRVVNITKMFMTGNLQLQFRYDCNTQALNTWEAFKAWANSIVLPQLHTEEWECKNKLLSGELRQGDSSLTHHIQAFKRLLTKVEGVSEEDKIILFRNSLNFSQKEHSWYNNSHEPFTTLDKLLEHLRKVESVKGRELKRVSKWNKLVRHKFQGAKDKPLTSTHLHTLQDQPKRARPSESSESLRSNSQASQGEKRFSHLLRQTGRCFACLEPVSNCVSKVARSRGERCTATRPRTDLILRKMEEEAAKLPPNPPSRPPGPKKIKP